MPNSGLGVCLCVLHEHTPGCMFLITYAVQEDKVKKGIGYGSCVLRSARWVPGEHHARGQT